MAFHDPFQGGLAVDDVVVGGLGDVSDGDAFVVNDGGFVGDAFAGGILGLAELHLGDAEVFIEKGGEVLYRLEDRIAYVQTDSGVGLHGLVVEVPVGQVPACLGVGAEVGVGFYGGDAGEFLAKVIRIPGAVVRGMQQSVNVVEEVFVGNAAAFSFGWISFLEMG